MKQIYVERITKQAAGDGIASNVKSDPARISNTVQKKQKTAAVADILVNRTQNNRAISKSYSVADNLFFEPSQYTISYVLKAIAKSCKSKKQVMVHLWGGKTILIDAAQGRILTDISNSQMRPLGIAAINNSNTKVKIKTADTAEIVDFSPRINDAIRVTGIDEFLWHLGFITARGRSPKSLDNNVPFNLQKPVYINEWPNFTRLAPIPHAIQIVAYWIQQPTSLSDLSKHLQVDAEYISGLFFACHSIGIAGQTHHHADNIVERKCTVKHKHRSLFGAILDHLKFNG